jgi:hypothetical protein
VKVLNTRTVVSEDEEEHNIIRERLVSWIIILSY